MKNTFFLIAVFICLVLVASSYRSTSTAPHVGEMAPALALEPLELSVKAAENSGKFVLISFWSSADAASRNVCNEYTAWLRNHPKKKNIELFSVNFDNSLPLFREIVKNDSLMPENQYNVSGAQAEAIKSHFDLGDNYGSLLINPAGLIVAYNPQPENLQRLTR